MSQAHSFWVRGPRIRENLIQFINRLPLERKGLKGCWKVTVQWTARKRTESQNAKMHAMIGELANYTGTSESDMKDYVKDEWGPSITVTIGGVEKRIKKSTAEYDVLECGEMIDRLYGLGSRLNYVFNEGE